MFERFTSDARQAVVQAREEARLLHHGFVGCEHLLLALSGRPGTPAAAALAAFGLDTATLRQRAADQARPGDRALDADALASLGIDLDTVRRATEASFGRGALDRGKRERGRSGPGGSPSFTPRAKKSLELALRSAAKLNDKEITSSHVLLGLISQTDNGALRILSGAGVETDALRQELAKRMSTAA